MNKHPQAANAIRALAMDAVQQANSGHPGMPMGMADIATVLWQQFLRVDPQQPSWANRDRFVLSNGHGSMLQYACLHLSGFALSIDDLKAFRQLHSKTPGHPEFDEAPGIETTTGPLGQGLANAVGMAWTEQHLAAKFNRDDFSVVDHFTYVFAGDGCLMEGISHEASSLAGTWGLGKLIMFWDDNGISIDGEVEPWFTDDTPARFAAYGWQVIQDVDGHDQAAIAAAITEAQADTSRPTIICCRTQIGFGSPNLVGTATSHGAPLGDAEIKLARLELGWEHPSFVIPDDIYEAWSLVERGSSFSGEWQKMFSAYEAAHPELAAEFMRCVAGDLPASWERDAKAFIATVQEKSPTIATRKASVQALDRYSELLPELVGGSADLTGSNCTRWADATDFAANNHDGRYVRYGVREFGMAAIMNGMSLAGGVIPFGGTFLTFLDYARNAVRLSAMMQRRVIYVFSHDSIGLGEDGPTHQPIEHANMLRMTPGIDTWRPADAVETAVAWQQALEQRGPSALLLTRQAVPGQQRDAATLDNVARGGYVLFEPDESPVAVIIATGSEVGLAMAAKDELVAQQLPVRVVSMPCAERFLAQDTAYRANVLPATLNARVVVEAGAPDYWYRFAGDNGRVLGISRFGVSAPAEDAYAYLGITATAVVEAVRDVVTGVTV